MAVFGSVYLAYLLYTLVPSFVTLLGSTGTVALFTGLGIVVLLAVSVMLRLSGYFVGILAAGILVVALGAGIEILTTVQNSLSASSLTASQANSLNNVFSSVSASYGLLPVVLIVVAAGAIIFMITFFMNFAAGRYADASSK